MASVWRMEWLIPLEYGHEQLMECWVCVRQRPCQVAASGVVGGGREDLARGGGVLGHLGYMFCPSRRQGLAA